MDISTNAPLYSQHTIAIRAPRSEVWALLTSINEWPRWHGDISRAHLEGALAIGMLFRWTSGGTAIVSTIRVLEPQQQFGWTGQALGTTTQHLWTLQDVEGATLVTTTEAMSGWLIRVVKLFAPKFLDNALQTWLAALKQTAEARGAGGISQPPAR